MFLAMGVGGGLAGAAMVWLNQRVTNLRKRFVPSTQPSRRVVEVVLLAAVTSSVWLLLCYVSPCGTVPENASPFIGGAVQGPREGPPSGVDRDSPLLYTNIFPQVGQVVARAWREVFELGGCWVDRARASGSDGFAHNT